MLRKLIASAFLCAVIIVSFLAFYRFLEKHIVPADLKRATERRIGAFLKTPVQVDRIRVGLLKHISLTGVQIKRAGKNFPVLMGIRKIVVQYDLASFFRRNFRIPAEIFLDTPHLVFPSFELNGSLFDLNLLKGEHGIVTRFEFEEGEIEFPWLRPGEKLRLVRLEGKAVPKKGDAFDVRFKAELDGALSGSLLGYGEIKPGSKEYSFVVSLADVRAAQGSPLEIRAIHGTVELDQNSIYIRGLQGLVHGVPFSLSGEVGNFYSREPFVSLSIETHGKNLQSRFESRADFKAHTVSGLAQFGGRDYKFQGTLSGHPSDFEFSRLHVNDAHEISGHFNLEAGRYQMAWGEGKRRLELDLAIHEHSSELAMKLDHLNLYGYDIVTYTALQIKPSGRTLGHFDLDFKTDYLIFQHQLLRDFKASAEISKAGLQNIVADWGRISELRCKILFARIPQADLTLSAGPIALDEFNSFGVHPLSLGGKLEGKIQVQGPVDRPNVVGSIAIDEGTAGSLDYDRAVLNFSGQLPYLMLNDSKVWKGRNCFLLTGGFNFAIRNFLEGIQIDNSEHVVIWKGLELSGGLEGPQLKM